MRRNFILVVGVILMAFSGARLATQIGLIWELVAFALGIPSICFSYTVDSKKKIHDLAFRISVLEDASVKAM